MSEPVCPTCGGTGTKGIVCRVNGTLGWCPDHRPEATTGDDQDTA